MACAINCEREDIQSKYPTFKSVVISTLESEEIDETMPEVILILRILLIGIFL